jgi:hypothetical protein
MTAFAASGNQRPFIMRKGISKLEDLADGYLGLGGFAVGAKTVYFVDGNCGSDSAEGIGGWGTSVKTLTKAFALSNADIASNSSGWAAHNVIFIRGDEFVENLTTLPNKCDVISVGSYDAHPTGIRGIHPIGNTGYMNTRFINCYFDTAGAGGDMITLPATVSGLSFLNCTFNGYGATCAGSAIVASGTVHFTVKDCQFVGGFTDSVIELLTGTFNDLRIVSNFVAGHDVGIECAAATFDAYCTGLIADNYVVTHGVCIKDTSGLMAVINNRVITLGAHTDIAGTGMIVDGAGMSVGNMGSASDIENVNIPVLGTLD